MTAAGLSAGAGNEALPAAPSPPKPPRNVHVLFVHGVGKHSRLSSLLQPYQAIRSNLRSPETPVNDEDLIPGWQLSGFEEDASPPFLKLESRYKGALGEPEAVYFYEVNYSNLAGVVRENHPLDLTRLFVGFDLAANAARARLQPAQTGSWPLDHVTIAKCVQKIAGVFTAATVPLLGIPAVLLRNYTRTMVSTFTRFFEDIATFAMDKDGEQLISAHVDRSVESIVDARARFCPADLTHGEDRFVIAAHSLGTVVAHNYLVRHWEKGGREVPSSLLTFGSPIGLVCWLWLYLDYPGMVFDPDKDTGGNYFCWTPRRPGKAGLQSLHWINVVNNMDPIATAFPTRCADLLRPLSDVQGTLEAGGVDTRFIRTGGALSVGSAHTAYLDDRTEFLKILTQVSGLRPLEAPEGDRRRDADAHWPQMLRELLRLRGATAFVGIVLVFAYFAAIACAYGEANTFWLLPLYLLPPLTVGYLAFFQRLLFGGPTKRTQPQQCWPLPVLDMDALPYRLRVPVGWLVLLVRVRWRQWWRKRPGWERLIRHRVPWPRRIKVDPNQPRSGLLVRFAEQLLAFVPTLAIAAAPVLFAWGLSGANEAPYAQVTGNITASLGLFALFFFYLICFAVSEFADKWRQTIEAVLRR